MSVYENSRYSRSVIEDRGNGVEMIPLRTRHKFDMNNATTYEWQEGDTLDGVAYYYYEDMDLRWAILDANPSYRSELDIKIGDILYIPDYDEVVDFVDV